MNYSSSITYEVWDSAFNCLFHSDAWHEVLRWGWENKGVERLSVSINRDAISYKRQAEFNRARS